MTDKKETERERESGVVLSELGRFYRHAANRSLQTLEGSKKRSASIYIYTHARSYGDKTANFGKASVFLRDVHSSGLKWRIPLERRPEKDESTRARPSIVSPQSYRRANERVTRSYVPRGVHDEWVEKARLETEWQDAKLWIPPPNSARTHPTIPAVFSSPSPSLCSSPPFLPRFVFPYTRTPQPSLSQVAKLLFFAGQFLHLQPGCTWHA